MAFGFGFAPTHALITMFGQNRYAAIINDAGELAPYVTFTRSSTATRYNSAGLLKTVAANAPRYDYDPTTVTRANLLTYSEQFDNAAWQVVSSSISANTTLDPTGTSTADALIEASATSAHALQAFLNLNSSTQRFTLSVYAKANQRSKLQVEFAGPLPYPAFRASFDLNTGQVITSSASGTAVFENATITAAQNGFYRVSISGYTGASGAHAVSLFILNNSGQVSYLGDGTSGLFIWGAQLEVGSTATAYIPTTASPVGNATLRGLLIEEQRTNLAIYSIGLTGGWSSDNIATMAANVAVSPDGTVNASQLQYVSNTYRYINITTVASTVYAYSVFAKLGTGGNGSVRITGAGVGATFNLNTLAITNNTATTANITAVGNGWYRLAITFTASSTSTLVDVSMPGTFTAGQGHFFYGAQLEAGAFATSYIPTTTAAVTRAQDIAEISSVTSIGFNASEGTVFAEAITSPRSVATATAEPLWSLANTLYCARGASTRAIGAFIGAATFSAASFSAPSSAFKSAVGFAANNGALSVNAESIVTRNDTVVPAVTSMRIGSRGIDTFNGHIRRMRYYNRRLPNATLQALTAP